TRTAPGRGGDPPAHQPLALAARAIEAVGRPPAGLFAGLAGLGLVASCLSGGGARDRRPPPPPHHAPGAPGGGSRAGPGWEELARHGRPGDRLAPGLGARVAGWRSGTST